MCIPTRDSGGQNRTGNTHVEQGSRLKKYVIHLGDTRESNAGPLAPKARIIPLDQYPIVNVQFCSVPNVFSTVHSVGLMRL